MKAHSVTVLHGILQGLLLINAMLSHLLKPAEPRPQKGFHFCFCVTGKLGANPILHQAQGTFKKLNRSVNPFANRQTPRPPHLVGVDGICQGLDVLFHRVRITAPGPGVHLFDFPSRSVPSPAPAHL